MKLFRGNRIFALPVQHNALTERIISFTERQGVFFRGMKILKPWGKWCSPRGNMFSRKTEAFFRGIMILNTNAVNTLACLVVRI
jgi:hypothetical protein